MLSLPPETIAQYRAETYRHLPHLRLKSRAEAVEYVNERGFVYFWPIAGAVLPSLWGAVVGDRPVADNHDDPGHITWGWKDSALGERLWYYAKILRKKATLISLPLTSYFYALSQNYGAPEEDYLTLYQQGRLTQEAKAIFETLLVSGALDTVALRKKARLASPENEARFNKALADLQADFKIVPVGVTQAGAWHYAFAYDLVHRHHPEIVEQARGVSDREAYSQLLRAYLRSVGAAPVRDISRLLGWTSHQVEKVAGWLFEADAVIPVEVQGESGLWFADVKMFG